MKKIITKYFSFRIFFWFCITSFIASACQNSFFAITDITSYISYKENNLNYVVSENDTITKSEIQLTVQIENEHVQNKNQCLNFLNPIGALMALTIPNEWCANSAEILITSNNDFNNVSAGNSLNQFFTSFTDENIDDYVTSFIQLDYLDEIEKALSLKCSIKPTLAQQKFFIQLNTDKGNFQTETVNFYWK